MSVFGGLIMDMDMAIEAVTQKMIDGICWWVDFEANVARQSQEITQDALAQSRRVSALDVPFDEPYDCPPTPGEAWAAVKLQAGRTIDAVWNLLDPSYHTITWEQAVDRLRAAGLLARTGGMEEMLILGGRLLGNREDGSKFYEDPFSIYRHESTWVVGRCDREMYARSLDEAVNLVIREYFGVSAKERLEQVAAERVSMAALEAVEVVRRATAAAEKAAANRAALRAAVATTTDGTSGSRRSSRRSEESSSYSRRREDDIIIPWVLDDGDD